MEKCDVAQIVNIANTNRHSGMNFILCSELEKGQTYADPILDITLTLILCDTGTRILHSTVIGRMKKRVSTIRFSIPLAGIAFVGYV